MWKFRDENADVVHRIVVVAAEVDAAAVVDLDIDHLDIEVVFVQEPHLDI